MSSIYRHSYDPARFIFYNKKPPVSTKCRDERDLSRYHPTSSAHFCTDLIAHSRPFLFMGWLCNGNSRPGLLALRSYKVSARRLREHVQLLFEYRLPPTRLAKTLLKASLLLLFIAFGLYSIIFIQSRIHKVVKSGKPALAWILSFVSS
jgi:hypothetical protein